MKRILRKTKFITIVVFIIFTVVASNGISHHQLVTNAQVVNKCLPTDSVSCNDTSKYPILSAPNPNLKLSNQERFLSAIANKLPTVPQPGTFEYTLLHAYGAAFVNQDTATKLPSKVIFADEQETQDFQNTLTMEKVNETNDCYLQKSAADALNKAQTLQKISLKSGYGQGDCTRSFGTNLKFWHKYANDKTLDKVKQGKETKILGLVAPPGTSQHLWGLAIDLRIANQKQREALYQNGWFQTVESDVPHWTYIGLSKEDLPLFGFKNKVVRGISYWLTPL
ncbi:D-alanyl-D-alanine carboxypeptidase family protein [Nostocaceae cyanobacterium CENA369]|uniref:D-alanyl-D-alanine carboxypeptidase family protein n=1 Tax=Dendronalium phyllosphericum CENA369 TaxID=1725256 RepID=A0A8J7I0U8_9NOST|nr:D-alanyl-D-alanine carboxypeptidase family protein [Dendronalium phyllosphericum]MBH8573751.1 D-alanyl-D-alanine carboxypeptidase family protein [Dendronalium phyllosphericum CENA369]